jgi:PAS domain S-box-containing protein
MKPISVYIVEDELIISASLKSRLENSGYEILGSSTRGESCLEEIERLSSQGREPEIVLMDIHLRGEQDGIETAKKINKRYNCGIVFLTGQSSKEVYERSFEIKPFGYLIKPIDIEQTKMTIRIAAYQRDLEIKNIKYQQSLETLLKQRTQEKNEIQLMYHTICESSLVAVMIVSNEKILYANKRCAEIFDFDIENFKKILPRKILEMFHAEDRQKISDPFIDYFTGKSKIVPTEFSLRLNHGKIKWLEAKIEPVDYLEKPTLSFSFIDVSVFKADQPPPEHG